MSFTRQHFQLIARVVSTVEDTAQRHALAMNFVSELQETNPGFKAGLFLKACNNGRPFPKLRAVSDDDRESRRKESFIAP